MTWHLVPAARRPWWAPRPLLLLAALGFSVPCAPRPAAAQAIGAVTWSIPSTMSMDTVPTARADSTRLITAAEWRSLGRYAVGAALLLPLDKAIAHAFERPSVQGQTGVGNVLSVIGDVGDPGALLLSAGTYAVGRLTHRPGLADAGLHATEAVLLSGVVTNVLKGVIGRARPYTVQGDRPFVFHPGAHEGYTAFPSGHTTVAFAAASAFSRELARSSWATAHPTAAAWSAPLLYGGAALVGVSRMYKDAHWASDVVMAAGIGTVTGRLIVRGQHARTPSRVEHWLLPDQLAPTRHGVALGWSRTFR
jgi:membrane-associated phospholipid phosphatase